MQAVNRQEYDVDVGCEALRLRQKWPEVSSADLLLNEGLREEADADTLKREALGFVQVLCLACYDTAEPMLKAVPADYIGLIPSRKNDPIVCEVSWLR